MTISHSAHTSKPEVKPLIGGCTQLNLTRAFEEPPPPLDFVALGLKTGSVGFFTSPGGVGKSMASLQIAMSVAARGVDDQLLGLGIESHGKVLILNAEDPLDVLHTRVHAIGALLSPDARASVAANLRIESLVGAGCDLGEATWVEAVKRASAGFRLVVLDTFSRWHRRDENSNSEMAGVVLAMETIAKGGPAVVALHHTAKAAALNGLGAEQQSARGASAIVDNARWQAFLETMRPAEALALHIPDSARRFFVKLGVSKGNYGPPIAERWLGRFPGGVLCRLQNESEMQEFADYLRSAGLCYDTSATLRAQGARQLRRVR